MRIHQSEMESLDKTAMRLVDGSGDYWGSMEVYHHLHCLKLIRHWIAIDHYPEDVGRLKIFPGHVYPRHVGESLATPIVNVSLTASVRALHRSTPDVFDLQARRHHVDLCMVRRKSWPSP